MIANWLDCTADQIFFTSGSTESANWIIQTFAPRDDKDKTYSFCRTKMEHPAVYNTLNFMARCGYDVSEIGNDHTGMVDDNDIWSWCEHENLVNDDKWLACIMDSNN